MFPQNNFEPRTQPWVRAVEDAVTTREREQPRLDKELERVQKESLSVLAEVSSNVNQYYQSTLAQYPVFSLTAPMYEVLGGDTKTVSISAPAAPVPPANPVAENWVSLFNHSFSLPFSVTNAVVRLNGVQFNVTGSASFGIVYRWVANGSVEAINTSRWMSRHTYNLTPYSMTTGNGLAAKVLNRNAYVSGTTSTLNVQLQARIYNNSNIAASVPAQNIVFTAYDPNNKNNPTYLDVMVTS